ncbi:MAG: hypothetical protein ABEJ27_04620 [Halodesulfurarchaeum sp.]
MKCPTCEYDFDPRDGLECPRCGETASCASLSCDECAACPSIVRGIRTTLARVREEGDDDPATEEAVSTPSPEN